MGLDTADLDIGLWPIAKSVLIFLGIPLLAGFLTRTIGEARKGTDWYEGTFLPRIGPIALYGLLFTIVVLFALQGEQITDNPLDVARVAVPLLVYFALMWGGSFLARLPTAVYPTNAMPPWRSPRPATTSSWRSPCRSRCSA